MALSVRIFLMLNVRLRTHLIACYATLAYKMNTYDDVDAPAHPTEEAMTIQGRLCPGRHGDGVP
jgi:hypothetical protein